MRRIEYWDRWMPEWLLSRRTVKKYETELFDINRKYEKLIDGQATDRAAAMESLDKRRELMRRLIAVERALHLRGLAERKGVSLPTGKDDWEHSGVDGFPATEILSRQGRAKTRRLIRQERRATFLTWATFLTALAGLITALLNLLSKAGGR